MNDIPQLTWEGVGGIIALCTALWGIYSGGIKRGQQDGKISALAENVAAQGKEIGDLRNKIDALAPASAMYASENRLQSQIATLNASVEEGFRRMTERIDRVLAK